MQQVALADNADHAALGVHDRGATDASLRQQCRQALDRCVWIDRDHIGRHHIYCAHCVPPDCYV